MSGRVLAAPSPACCSVAAGLSGPVSGLAGPGVAWHALLLRPDGYRDGAGGSGLPHDGGGGGSLPLGLDAAAPVAQIFSPLFLASWWCSQRDGVGGGATMMAHGWAVVWLVGSDWLVGFGVREKSSPVRPAPMR